MSTISPPKFGTSPIDAHPTLIDNWIKTGASKTIKFDDRIKRL